MIDLPPELRAALRANAIAHHDAMQHGEPEPDPAPVVKLFNPLGAATWLASEPQADGDTLFGLPDRGFGCPELGIFCLSEIAEVRLPLVSASSATPRSPHTSRYRSGRHGRVAPVRSCRPRPFSARRRAAGPRASDPLR